MLILSRGAAVKLPKCLEGPQNTYDRSTNNSRMQIGQLPANHGHNSYNMDIFFSLNLRVFIKE